MPHKRAIEKQLGKMRGSAVCGDFVKQNPCEMAFGSTNEWMGSESEVTLKVPPDVGVSGPKHLPELTRV